MKNLKLPSAFKHGDCVKLNFGESGQVWPCEITKVIFTHNKVLYDVEVHMHDLQDEDGYYMTRLHSVDSAFVESMDVEELAQ